MILNSTFVHALQSRLRDESKKSNNQFLPECESRDSLWILLCRVPYRDHKSGSRRTDYIEFKTKTDSKVHNQQSDQIHAMPTARNMVAMPIWVKLKDSLAYGAAGEDSSENKNQEKAYMA